MRTPFVFGVLSVALAMAAIGCGGSGGGTAPSEGVVTYVTDWSSRGRRVTGDSQVVRVFDMSRRQMRSAVLTFSGQTEQSFAFDPLPAGDYILSAELYSQAGGGGVLRGVIETQLTVEGPVGFRSAVGVDPTGIRVVPTEATIQVARTKPFFAHLTNGGNGVFAEPDSIVWEASNENLEVNAQTGIAKGLKVGASTLRATYGLGGLSAIANVSVTSGEFPRSKWTVLVYMNAANDLAMFSSLNVNQMEQVADNPDVRFVVQWKQAGFVAPDFPFQGTRRYLVRHDTTGSIASDLIEDMGKGVDMGSPRTLREFCEWGRSTFPSDRYVLVIWNHGNGWRRAPHEAMPTRGVSYDDEFGTSINTWELAQNLGPDKWDIIAWDASLMQMLEVAYEIQDQAQFVVGSEESPPGEGYPYDRIFKVFRDNPNASTRDLTKAFVDGMLAVPEYRNRKITQSVIDTSRLPALATALNSLAAQLIANVNSIGGNIQVVRQNTQTYSQTSVRYYRDLFDLCRNIRTEIVNTPVRNAAQNVQIAVQNAVVWEGHNDQSPNSNGISIDFSPGNVFRQASQNDYARLRLAADTRWPEWLAMAP